MTHALSGRFDARREAEMAVERLVQGHGIDRNTIVIEAAGEENTAGEDLAGADAKRGSDSEEPRSDGPLTGAVLVAVEVANDEQAAAIREAFTEFKAADVAANG